MRPFKHAAPTQDSNHQRPQSVLGVAVARFAAPWGEIPVVATSEIDRISLLYWDSLQSRWQAIERGHAELSTGGTTTDAPTGWNWSDRVGLATSRDTVFVVYKRASTNLSDPNTPLTVERYRPADPTGPSHALQFVDSQKVPLLGTPGHLLGRSLWCGFDAKSEKLIVLCQSFASGFSFPPQPPRWQLLLLQIGLDSSGALTAKDTVLEDGGFDLDARIEDGKLFVVHRATPDATRFPLIMTLGGGLTLGSDPQSDAFYQPLRLLG